MDDPEKCVFTDCQNRWTVEVKDRLFNVYRVCDLCAVKMGYLPSVIPFLRTEGRPPTKL